MDQYDEDLLQNPFYVHLTSKHKDLYELAADERWTICVPRAGSLSDVDITRDDLESHIFIPQENDVNLYQTQNKKEVSIKSNAITTGAGFSEQKVVDILFEETHFNRNEESYCVVCINQPLEGEDNTADFQAGHASYNFVNKSVEECANLLWGTSGNVKTRKQLGSLIDAFLKRLGAMQNSITIKTIFITTKSFFDKAMTIVMKDPYMKRMSSQDGNFLECVKLAVETHLMHGVHKSLFKLICTCQSDKNAHLNKITRNLSHIQLQDLGVKMQYCQNVPRARKELSNLSLHRTPLGKINCIKRVVTALMRPSTQSQAAMGGVLPLTTDDLLPIMVFLVLKADIPAWWSHFEHLRTFRFSKSCLDNEYGFYMASLEAALHHVDSGQLLDLQQGQIQHPQLSPVTSETQDQSIWQRQEQDSQAVEQLFQFIKDGNKAAVEEILKGSKLRRARANKETPSPARLLCHPLCSCEKCKPKSTPKHRRTPSIVTENSRDPMGFTVLHMVAFYGHIEIADIVLQQGALMDATDSLGQTPLHITCKKGHQAVTLLLLHHGASVNATDGECNTPLHLAALNGHEDCAKALVFFDQGVGNLNINAVNDFGDTALHLATKWGYESLVSFLLENRASALIRNRKRYDALRYAHSQTLCDLLTKAIADQVNQKRAQHRYHGRILRKSESLQNFGHIEGSSRGLTKSLSVVVPTNLSSSSLVTPQAVSEAAGVDHAHVKAPHPVAVGNQRRQSEASISEVSLSRKKIDKLLKAAADDDINMVKFHLGWNNDSDGEGSDLDLSKQELCHPLCQCERCKPLQKFTTLSQKSSVHVNSQDQQGYTALHVAAQNGHLDLMTILLRRGADVNICTFQHDISPLHLACKQRSVKVVDVLLEYRADVNLQDSEGNTPVFHCCMAGNERMTELLIKRQAHLNHFNHKGNMPLHEGVRWNFIGIVRLLIKHGASLVGRNMEHKLPLHYSQTEEMSQLLRDAMIKKKPRETGHTKDFRRALSLQIPEGQSFFDSTDGLLTTDSAQRSSRSMSVSHTSQDLARHVAASSQASAGVVGSSRKSERSPIAEVRTPDFLTSGAQRDMDKLTLCTVDPNVILPGDIPVISGLTVSPGGTESDQCEPPTTDKEKFSLWREASVEGLTEGDTISVKSSESLVVIDNYFEAEKPDNLPGSSKRKHCLDDSRDSDCSSENSKTESQQDLSMD